MEVEDAGILAPDSDWEPKMSKSEDEWIIIDAKTIDGEEWEEIETAKSASGDKDSISKKKI